MFLFLFQYEMFSVWLRAAFDVPKKLNQTPKWSNDLHNNFNQQHHSVELLSLEVNQAVLDL